MADIELLPNQVGHVQRLLSIYEKYTAALDLSVMGSGKTITTLAIARSMRLPIFVICTKSARPMWTAKSAEFGVELIDVLNYESLRSRRFCKLKHPWLIRTDKEVGANRIKTSFSETADLARIVDAGVLIVFDEVHIARNASDQTLASHALMYSVFRSGPTHAQRKSRIIALSGSPALSPEEYCRHMRIVGVYTEETLYTNHGGDFKLTGARSVMKAAFIMDPLATQKVVEKSGSLKSKENVIAFCYELYRTVISRYVVSAMPEPPSEGQLIVSNALMDLEGFPTERAMFLEALKAFEKQMFEGQCLARDDDAWYIKHLNPANITKQGVMGHFRQLELSIVPAVMKHALNVRKTDPRAKLVFMFCFLDSVEKARQILVEHLGEERVGVLIGEVGMNDRAKLIERFQKRALRDEEEEEEEEKADPEPALYALCGILKVMSSSISLHDTVGDEPRHAYIASNADVLNSHQATRRFLRVGSKGISTVNMCYGHVKLGGQVYTQSRMIDAIARRSATLSETLDEQVKAGVKFPGQYPSKVIRG